MNYIEQKKQEFEEIFEGVTLEFDDTMTYQQGNVIERLLNNAILTEQEERVIHSSLYGRLYNQFEAQEVIDHLYNNQIDPILSGNAYYSQTDILKTLTKIK